MTGATKEQRSDTMNAYMALPKRRRSFRLSRLGHVLQGHDHREHKGRKVSSDVDLLTMVQQFHELEGQEAREMIHRHEGMYSNKNMLKRESIRFDPGIVGLLSQLWAAIDVDKSGSLDAMEYRDLYLPMYRAMHGPATLEEVEEQS